MGGEGYFQNSIHELMENFAKNYNITLKKHVGLKKNK